MEQGDLKFQFSYHFSDGDILLVEYCIRNKILFIIFRILQYMTRVYNAVFPIITLFLFLKQYK